MSKALRNFEYDVFTRIKRGDNLIHIGTVEAPTDELAGVYANYIYDEEDWVEMCVVRRDHIYRCFLQEGLFEKEGGSRQ